MFTYDFYSSLIQTFLDNKYHFSFFGCSEPSDNARCIYLRHDVDFDIFNVLKIAQIENEKGVASTWFFQPNNDFYNILSSQSLKIIRKTHDMKNRIGLHIDASSYATLRELIEEINVLYDFYKRYIPIENIISFHRPAAFLLDNTLLPGFIGTYEDRFFRDIAYISDSARRKFWEEEHLQTALKSGKSLQLLTHPIWWKDREYSLQEIIDYMRTKAKIDISDYALKNNCKIFAEYKGINGCLSLT